MATREERIRIAFEADLSDMRKELAKLPEISSKEAAKMVKALEKQYKRAEKAAKKTAKAQKDSAGKVTAGFEAAKQAATGFGGAIGGAGGQVEAFARSMIEASKAIGPVGVGVIAAGLAIVGIGVAVVGATRFMVGMISQAEELLTTLQPFTDAGIFAPIPPETQASIEAFNDAMDGLGVVGDRVKLEFGGDLADAWAGNASSALLASIAVHDLTDEMGGLRAVVAAPVDFPVDALGRWVDGINEGIPALRAFGAAQTALANTATHAALEWAGYGEKLDEWRLKALKTMDVSNAEASAVEDAAEATKAAAATKKKAAEAEAKATKAAAAATKNAADADRAREKALRGAIKAMHEQEAAQDSLTKITAAASADLLTAEDKIRNAHEDRIDAILEVGMASKDTAAVTAAIHAADARQIRELDDLDLERTKRQKKQLQELEDLKKMFHAALEERARSIISDTLRDIDLVASSIGGTVDTLAGLRIDHIEETFNANAEAIEKEGTKRRRLEEAAIAGLLEVGKIDQIEADSRLERLDEQDKADEKKINKLKRISEAAAIKSFKTQKAIAKALAIIDGARAAVAMVPGFMYLTPLGAVAAAAALAVAATGAQLAVIGAQKPPEFPMGGLVADRLPGGTAADHVAISAQPSEGIVTGRGMDGLGRGGLDNINQGGGGGPMSISLTIGSTVIARAILETPDLIRQITAELQIELGMTSGRVPVYGRG